MQQSPIASTSKGAHQYEEITGANFAHRLGNQCVMQGMNIEMDEDDEVTLKGCCSWIRQRFFTREKMRRRVPVVSWLVNYNWDCFKGDLIAGITVAFTIIPQALAFALLAGLSPKYGLYSSFMACFVYAFLGNCPEAAIGPTSILAILTAPSVSMGGATYAILLSFYTGLTLLFLGLFNLGFILDFVSYPVISAFSTSAALVIIVTQLKSFFGLEYSSSGFISNLVHFFGSLTHIQLYDTLLSLLCLVILILLKLSADFQWATSDNRTANKNRLMAFVRRLFNGSWFFLATARNALVVLISIGIAARYPIGLHFTGPVSARMPEFRVPNFLLCQTIQPPTSISTETDTVTDSSMMSWVNGTTPVYEEVQSNLLAAQDYHHNKSNDSDPSDVIVCNSFGQTMSDLYGTVLVIVLVALLEATAVIRSFGGGRKMDSTQEMIAIGTCNLLGSFVGAIPVTASFSRSAVNKGSGVKTPFSGLVCSGLVLFAIWKLNGLFERIPQAALSAIIIVAISPMVKFGDLVRIWKANPLDLLPYSVTALLCVFVDLQFGVLFGILFSLLLLLYQMARPKVTIVCRLTPKTRSKFIYVKADRSIFFPSVEYMKVKIHQALSAEPEMPLNRHIINCPGEAETIENGAVGDLVAVVIDGEHMFRGDTTFAVSLKNLVAELRAKRLLTIFYNMRKSTHRVLRTLLTESEFICCHNEAEVYAWIETIRFDPSPVIYGKKRSRLSEKTSMKFSVVDKNAYTSVDIQHISSEEDCNFKDSLNKTSYGSQDLISNPTLISKVDDEVDDDRQKLVERDENEIEVIEQDIVSHVK